MQETLQAASLREIGRLFTKLYRLLKNSVFDVQPLKGASDFEELTASLKRCPDTKREFFSKLISR
jgi:hypothetical protein